MMENQLSPFNFVEEKNKQQQERKFYKLYVGIDIGASFHVAACIQFQAFMDPTGREWKRVKTMKFNADSLGLTTFLDALKQAEKAASVKRNEILILLEPTGGHYSFLITQLLLQEGYELFQVENKSVKEFRERTLGISEKSDAMDARIMAYMGFHKTLHPNLHGVRLLKPASQIQSIFRTLTRDRWLLSVQLTRRKNQVQQLLQITHPDLKVAFKKPGSLTALRFVRIYPSGVDLLGKSEEELKNSLIQVGAKATAKKASQALYEITKRSLAIQSPHLLGRQKMLIEEALRLEESIKDVDAYITSLLHGNVEQGIEKHPYTDLLYSLPFMSDTWACTLVGTIGDIDRFNTYKEFKKHLGVSAENSQSGTSVKGTRQTFSGARDTRRVLFQMALIVIATKKRPTVFRAYYNSLVERGMPKRKAIGHMCGKIAKLIYTILKNRQPYDSIIHAKACGIPWEDIYDSKIQNIDSDSYLVKAMELNGEEIE
ncbi:IS110 family transposase [Bacillus mycoides]|uniref:IS110 family transposase n=1 Tax=Bacillus mycoides TaxID=1405 RepID=UPI003D22B265